MNSDYCNMQSLPRRISVVQILLVYLHLSSFTSSHSGCPTPSTYLSRSVSQFDSTTIPHLFLPACLSCHSLHINKTALPSQQTSIGFISNTPALTVYITPSSSPRFRRYTLWRHPYQSWTSRSFSSLCSYNVRSLLSNEHIFA